MGANLVTIVRNFRIENRDFTGDDSIVCTENLSSGVVVVKSAKGACIGQNITRDRRKSEHVQNHRDQHFGHLSKRLRGRSALPQCS
jgi:hypothetical protein